MFCVFLKFSVLCLVPLAMYGNTVCFYHGRDRSEAELKHWHFDIWLFIPRFRREFTLFSMMASSKKNIRKQEFISDYKERWDFIIPGKDKFHARCTTCNSDVNIAHGGSKIIYLKCAKRQLPYHWTTENKVNLKLVSTFSSKLNWCIW